MRSLNLGSSRSIIITNPPPRNPDCVQGRGRCPCYLFLGLVRRAYHTSIKFITPARVFGLNPQRRRLACGLPACFANIDHHGLLHRRSHNSYNSMRGVWRKCSASVHRQGWTYRPGLPRRRIHQYMTRGLRGSMVMVLSIASTRRKPASVVRHGHVLSPNRIGPLEVESKLRRTTFHRAHSEP